MGNEYMYVGVGHLTSSRDLPRFVGFYLPGSNKRHLTELSRQAGSGKQDDIFE